MEKPISRRQIVLILAVLVTLAAVCYGLLVKQETAHKYDGLTLWLDVQMEDSIREMVNERILITQAAIEAQEAAGQEVDLILYESLASDANFVGNLVLARETYEAYLQRNPINHVVWNSYGMILYWMGDYKVAEEAHRQAVTLYADEQYYSNLVWDIEKQTDTRNDEVIAILKEGVTKLGQTQWFMVALGERLLKAGDCEGSLAHYNVALTLDPKNEALQKEMADAQAACAQ